MTDHTDLRDRVEALLKDASNVDWSTAELDDAIRLALHYLSGSLPVRGVSTVDAVTDQYEYSIVAITGLVCVVEVWYPYLSTHATYKLEHAVPWRMLDESTLLIEPADCSPNATYDLRVFYDRLQTLAGLDSAATTTLDSAEKSAIVIGAAGYAAIALARDKIDAAVFGAAQEEASRWGWGRVNEFKTLVVELGDREAAGDDARIGWWKVDKRDV